MTNRVLAVIRYDGREFRSITAIARAVTGYPAISGPAWFGIAERAAATPKVRRERGACVRGNLAQPPLGVIVSTPKGSRTCASPR